MPTNAPFTVAEQNNTAQEYIAQTAINYQNETDLYSLLTDAPKEQINSKGLIQPIEVAPNPSLMASNLDGGAVPTVGARDLNKFTVNYAALVQGRGVTYEAELNNNKNTAEDEVMASLKSDLRQQTKFVNDYVSRGNGTWALGIVSGYTNPSTTVTVNTTGDTIGGSQLAIGGHYTFWNAAGTTQRVGTVGSGAIKLNSRTATALTMATNAPSDVVATDIIAPEIGVTNAATGALVGLPYIYDDTTDYFGLSRSTVPQLKSYVKSTAGTLTAGMLMEVYANIKSRGGYGYGSSTDLIDMLEMFVGITQYQNYYNLSLSAGAVVGSPNYFIHDKSGGPKMDLGMANMDFTWFNAPIRVLNSAKGDEIYFANRKELKRAVLKPLGKCRDIFGEDQLLVNSSNSYTFTKVNFHDFVGQVYSPRPFRGGKISGITVTNLAQTRNTIS